MVCNHPLLAHLSDHVFIPCHNFSPLSILTILEGARRLRSNALEARRRKGGSAKVRNATPRVKARGKRALLLDATITLDYEGYLIACKHYRIIPLEKPE